jgi:hypothetical protein
MAKRVTAKKSAARKTAAKKPTPKKLATKKPAAEKPVAEKVARKTPCKWTDKKRVEFLAVLAGTANVSSAAAAIGMSRTAAYVERARNADFAKGWKQALDVALDELELAVFERATHGYDKDVFRNGIKTDTMRLYSDALAMFLLRAHRAHIYGKSPEGAPALDSEQMRAAIEAKLGGESKA